MKRLAIFFWVAVFLFLLPSCSKDHTGMMDNWLAYAKLNAREPPDELYAKALQEDTLIIYSNSTRSMDVKKSFEEQYPGLTVYIYDMRSVDLVDKLVSNINESNYCCDLVICDDNNGVLSQKLMPNGILYKYIPYDIADKLMPESEKVPLAFIGEIQLAYYNTEVYSAPPFQNWWELTEDRFKGKIVMPNPLKSFSTMGFFSTIIKNSDKMEQAYYDLYGSKLKLENGESAGEAFWRMLIQNDLRMVNSSDEVLDLFGTSGQTDLPIGIMISSKVRMQDTGYKIASIYNVAPFTGTYSPENVMIAGGSKNISSAKLFIRWLLGETDGQGKGYKPYLQNGTWSVRSDVKSETPIPLNDIKTVPLDVTYIYQNRSNIESFFKELVKTE